jgi:formylglycine-generating enzyme required for sulfatase activity
MRPTPRVLTLGSLGLFLHCAVAWAFLPRDDIQLSSVIVVNRAGQSPRAGCEMNDRLETHLQIEGRFAVSVKSPDAVEGAAGEPTGLSCAWKPMALERTPGTPGGAAVSVVPAGSLAGSVKIVARSHRQMEDERVIEVEVTVTLHRGPGSRHEEETPREESLIERDLFFADPSTVLIPLFVSDGGAAADPGISEMFLRVEVGVPSPALAASYGAITVTTDLAEAELLLDGGVVGSMPAGGETTLHNVRSGLREVGLHAASGEAVTKMVRVVSGRTVLADLRQGASRAAPPTYRLTPLGRNNWGYEEFRRGTDEAVVVKIPAGEFLMGNRNTERHPMEHKVYVSEFLMDRTAVTWGQFKKFSEATGIPLPRHEPYWGIHDDHPVVYVTWEEAKSYCEWAGARLPTEAEREKAARGTDGRKYPWGDEEPNADRGVHRRTWGYLGTGAVGKLPAGTSPYGLQDMGGNVWEWCADWYDGEYYAESPYRDPTGPLDGLAHVVRGGSWDSRPDVLSASCRSWGHRGYRDGDFGFRCAMSSIQGN